MKLNSLFVTALVLGSLHQVAKADQKLGLPLILIDLLRESSGAPLPDPGPDQTHLSFEGGKGEDPGRHYYLDAEGNRVYVELTGWHMPSGEKNPYETLRLGSIGD